MVGGLDRRFCIAPMLDRTDRHCRYWLRLIFPDALLYSEMITTAALLHGDVDRLLAFNTFEKPLALQLGGNQPDEMAHCAKIAQEHGYDEVNINVGCPSDRVQSGTFGACLMAQPKVVAQCIMAMQRSVQIPVTVKTRIGIDAIEDYRSFRDFVACLADAGCRTVIVHARKAWLRGLSPKQNREIPPLRYDYVYRLKKDFPQLEVIINGGVRKVEDIVQHLKFVDGTMIGRAAYEDPYALIRARNVVFGHSDTIPERNKIIERYIPYINEQLAENVSLNHITRHMLGLFQAVPGAKQWRRHLTEYATQPYADSQVVLEALQKVSALRKTRQELL